MSKTQFRNILLIFKKNFVKKNKNKKLIKLDLKNQYVNKKILKIFIFFNLLKNLKNNFI